MFHNEICFSGRSLSSLREDRTLSTDFCSDFRKYQSCAMRARHRYQ